MRTKKFPQVDFIVRIQNVIILQNFIILKNINFNGKIVGFKTYIIYSGFMSLPI